MEVIRRTMVEIRISGEQVELLYEIASLAKSRILRMEDLGAYALGKHRLRAFVDELLEATRRE